MKKTNDISLKKDDNLLKRFEEIHDFIYSNDGLSSQQTLEEIVKILFLKIVDENNESNEFVISNEEFDEIRNGYNNISVATRLADLFEKTKLSYKNLFDVEDKIKLSAKSLGFTINKLQGISFVDTAQDAKGLAFQKFLSHHEKDGRGQFFTPEPVIDFCVKMIMPSPKQTVIDPACGSGGFLNSTLKFLKANFPKFNVEQSISDCLFGMDINKSIARIAKMKLLLEANGKTNVLCANSLEDIDQVKLALGKEEGFDILLANPPFGAKITDKSILLSLELGHKWKKGEDGFLPSKIVYENQNAEILFIERCLQLLKEGGKMAIVLPNGNFENPSLEYLRYFIKLKAKILAIVNLPSETFIPYGTGVKTSLLFLEKDSLNLQKEYPIFFARIKKLGYQGNKNGTPIYKKDSFGKLLKDNSGNLMLDQDFDEVVDSYKEFLTGKMVETDNSFSILYNELAGRFDYDFYSPENRKMFQKLDKGTVVKLGDICEIVKIKSRLLKEPNKEVEYVELSDINTHSFEIINSTTHFVYELPSRASYDLKEGDIITAIAGNSVGTKKHATAMVTKDFEGSVCTNGFRILRNSSIDKYYLLYFLKSDMFLRQMFMYRTGAAIPNVSDADLMNIKINLPDEKIINQISAKMKKAFDLRRKSKEEIESISF